MFKIFSIFLSVLFSFRVSMNFAKVAGDFNLVASGFGKLIGASIKVKSGSIGKLIVLPPNNSSSASTKLMTFVEALDKLTEGSIRSVTTNLYSNTEDTIPDDKPSAPKPMFLSGMAVKHSGGVVTPGFRFEDLVIVREPNLDIAKFGADPGDALNTAQRQYRNLIDLMYGSYYGVTTTKIKKRSKFNTAIQATGSNPDFVPTAIFDAATNSINPLPETYIRIRLGDKTYFVQVPRLNFGSGAGVDDYDLESTAFLFTDAGINDQWTGKSNLTTLLAIAKIIQGFTKGQIQAIGMKIISNANADVPYDIVGREAVLPVTFRVTNSSDRTQTDKYDIEIPRYSNWDGLDQDAVAALIRTDLGGYFTSVFSSDGSDEVEVLY